MKNLLFVGMFFLLSCMSCKKDFGVGTIHIPNSFFITYEDTQGHDLLDPDHVDGINYGNVEVFEMIQSKKVKRGNQMYDNPKGLQFSYGDLFKTGEEFGIMQIWLNTDAENGQRSTTILEYDHYASDTIQAMIHRSVGLIKVTDIWVNGQLVSTNQPHLNPRIKLVKRRK
jgi:hypothetical protein